MPASTICFTGMDRDEEATLKALFAEANARLGEPFRLAMEADADVVVVDMDTIYGHMSWLKAHGRGRIVVALSERSHAETDHNLRRPYDEASLAELLRTLGVCATGADEAVPAESEESPAALTPAHAEAPEVPDAATDVAPESAPSPDEPPEDLAAAEESAADADAGGRLVDFLFPGELAQPMRLLRPGQPSIAVDPATQRWYGPAALKPLIDLAREPLSAADWSPVSSAELSESGEAQPLPRLVWLAALAAGEGALIGYAPATRFRLAKWPQTEREFPKHLRIGTALMKGPSTVAEVAQASGASEADVADFINASLATGFAEPESAAPGSAGKDGRLGHLPPRTGH